MVWGRLKKNLIPGLNINGSWIEDPSAVKAEIQSFFIKKFSEPLVDRPSFTSKKFKILSTTQVADLEQTFSMDELKQAIWSCEGSKAPGPDGFTMNFVKKNWDVLKSDFAAYLNAFNSSGLIPKGCNSNFITLIPKVSDPIIVSDFRPISLVGLQYKILSKVLAGRLKKVIPSIISESQTAFVEGRQILDGVLVANEAVAWAKKSKSKLMLLKVDFAKAFDYLNWNFLNSVMSQMGFGKKWRGWILSYISSARLSVLVNGSRT